MNHNDDNGSGGGCERLAMGKEVELGYNKAIDCFDLGRKTPSLDDVLDQVQGNHLCRRTVQKYFTVIHRGFMNHIKILMNIICLFGIEGWA